MLKLLYSDPLSDPVCLSSPHPSPLLLLLFLQKILTMIPTEEEKQRIQEAQLVNPDIPLGSAEQFLLTLSSITELSARLQLWAFKMDYEVIEKVRSCPCLLCITCTQHHTCEARRFKSCLSYIRRNSGVRSS